MKSILLCSSFFLFSFFVQGQNENSFDFWLGKWEAKWKNPQGQDLIGSNFIEKTLDGKVIQEHFEDPNTKFKGTSVSVYNPKTNTWHQAWADSQGAYFDFIGLFEKDRKIFSTDTSQSKIQRMVFYNIEETQFDWDWESSQDGGKTFQLQWRIHYTRVD